MNINIEKTPLSRYGASVMLSIADGKLYFRTVYGMWNNDRVFLITPTDGVNEIEYTVTVSPWLAEIKSAAGTARVYVKDDNTIAFVSNGLGFSFDCERAVVSYAVMKGENALLAAQYDRNVFAGINILHGKLDKISGNDRVFYTRPESGKLILEIKASDEEFLMPKPLIDYENDIANIKREFEEWTAAFRVNNPKYRETARLAAYIIWSSVINPKGYLTRRAVLMSKNWMHYVWSWDHCFNALALAEAYPRLAFDQFMLMLDIQAEDGRLPDMAGHNFISRMFTKPPVHGWCFLKLMKSGINLSEAELKEVYNKLAKWTRWWFNNRDADNDGICQYDHGNECGWDNCTLFDCGLSLETPELSAYLLIQQKCLSVIASKLGYLSEVEFWDNEYKKLFDSFLSHFTDGNKLKAVSSAQHSEIKSGSLLNYVTVVLGDMLPKEYFSEIVLSLKAENEFLTKYGLATESVKSEKYEKGRSYWRGSIWAPVILLITDGLSSGGETELAKEIATRFCDLVNEKDGIYENYDALSGLGNDDPAYTWTASVFLTLAAKEPVFN